MSKGQTANNNSGKETRDPKTGRFTKDNTIGSEYRFKEGNTLSTIYNDEYADKLLDYFREKIENGEVPFIFKWADDANISARAVSAWANEKEENGDYKHPRFAYIHAHCMCLQQYALMSGGLQDRLNARVVEFLLKNLHGMTDKVEQDISASGEFTVNIREVD